MNKKTMFTSISIAILLTITSFIILVSVNKKEITISTINVEDSINPAIEHWITTLQPNKGIHLYHVEHEQASHEYWLFFNKNMDNNLYIITEFKALMENDILKILITDKNATSDEQVVNEMISTFKINSKPNRIEVYYNRKMHPFDLESRNAE